MNKGVWIPAIVLVIITLGGIWYFNNKQTENSQLTTPSQPAQETPTPVSGSAPTTAASLAKEFMVASSGLSFTPNQIKVNKGDTVKITYKDNVGSHNFVIDEFNVKTKLLDAGQSEQVTFTADKAGLFEFYCSVPGHRAAGMKGSLVVE